MTMISGPSKTTKPKLTGKRTYIENGKQHNNDDQNDARN